MKVWTINVTNYEYSKDQKNGRFEFVAPFAVVRSRDEAVNKVLQVINEDRQEIRAELCRVDDLRIEDMKWTDCHTHINKMRWKFYDDFTEDTYVIAEHELTD